MSDSGPRVCVLGLACCGVEATAAASAGSGAADRDDHVLVVAGTVTTKLAPRLRQAWQGFQGPVTVVAYGACAISGGPYWDSYSVLPGAGRVIPVDVAVPGCPPRPGDLDAALERHRGASND